MDRRVALKNMGLALGYTVATPTLLSIVQSCKNDPAITWAPEFLSAGEGSALTQLVDLILPKTDTPSASDVNVDRFIDKFAAEVMSESEQNFFKMSYGRFLDKALTDAGKENTEDLTAEDLEPVLAAALKNTKEEEAKMFESISDYQRAMEEGTVGELDEVTSRFAFANNLRGMTIWGYKSSEEVGENILAYLPVPGEYIPCGDLQELTGGKAWSI